MPFDQTCPLPGSTPTTPIEGPEAIDGQGDLWVQAPDGPLYMWTADQLAQSCASTPATMLRVIVSADLYLNPVISLAFDSQGNLWAAGGYSIVGYRAADLLASGNIEPAWLLSGYCGAINQPCAPFGLAFDRNGFMWVGNATAVLAYAPSTLMAAAVANDGGTPHADFLITVYCNDPVDGGAGGCEGGNVAYGMLAFDAQGNLWVTSSVSLLSGQLMESSKAQRDSLGKNDEPWPAFWTYGTPNEAIWAHTLAFDSDGELWIGRGVFFGGDGGNLLRFNVGTLLDGGPPDARLNVPGDPSVSLAFSPIPSGLPIQP